MNYIDHLQTIISRGRGGCDDEGNTLLMCECMRGPQASEEKIQLLIKHCDLGHKNNKGQTALNLAIINNCLPNVIFAISKYYGFINNRVNSDALGFTRELRNIIDLCKTLFNSEKLPVLLNYWNHNKTSQVQIKDGIKCLVSTDGFSMSAPITHMVEYPSLSMNNRVYILKTTEAVYIIPYHLRWC